jgi:hypothetical protein
MSALDLFLLAAWAIPVFVIGGFAILAATLTPRNPAAEAVSATTTGRGADLARSSDRTPIRPRRAHRTLVRENAVYSN